MTGLAVVTSWDAWRAERDRSLREEYGWLSIVGFDWLGSDVRGVSGLPGLWSVRSGAAWVTADRSDGLTYEGEPIDGTFGATVSEAGSLLWLRHGRRLVELVLRGGRYAVRQRDPSAHTRLGFAGVPTFAPRSEWVVPGLFTPYPQPLAIEVATARSDLRQQVRAVGIVRFSLAGTEYELVATAGRGGAVTLTFHDETNGVDTAPWRAVSVGAPGPDGVVSIDFNRTTNLPFAFTPYGTCPAPIEGNRLLLPVTAGEQAPR
ncbi:DUF1684 domain-containing protein [Tenggerimyces flavus]|uniref:DUF1684 domain-containing protein n=1 Tax=Tenggerimyces flavus TaxID=1708749 RepID=A0ABV7YAI3_9ACTN|nr:DUF1684 domain-containing protein [Tenggerimyces flavus]MBM7789761.1 uncharacterized protein (DUF1684 family) [Tenggerimyces flavus]